MKNKSLIVIVVILSISVLGLSGFIISDKLQSNNQKNNCLTKIDAKTTEKVLNFLGIDPEKLTAEGGLNEALVSGNDLLIIENYAKENDLYEKEKYINENECVSSLSNYSQGMQSTCYLLSEENFNKIAELYNLISFSEMYSHEIYYDNADTYYDNDKEIEYYIYRDFTPIGGIFNDYEYVINSANYNYDKSLIIVNTTRVTNTNLENNIATDNIKYILKKNKNSFKLLDVEVENIEKSNND